MQQYFNLMKHSNSKYLLPLIAAASSINDFKLLRRLIIHAKAKQIPFLKLYETLLQNYLFAGYPSALASLKILKECYPAKKLSKAAGMKLYHSKIIGMKICKKVYWSKFEKLIFNINNFSPELAEWLVLEGYGKVLSRKGLSFKERELCIVSVLAALKFEDQLYSHINGAIKAKATVKDIETVMKNLKLLGKTNSFRFGIKVLDRYLREKGKSNHNSIGQINL